MSLPSLLAALVRHTRRHALLTVLAGLLLTALSAWYGATHLGVTTDTDALFSSSLPWRQRQIAWSRAFPQFNDMLVAVVDAKLPEQADETAAALAAALTADPAHFAGVRRPDASPYLARNGLMFLDTQGTGGPAQPHHRRAAVPRPTGGGPERARAVRGPGSAGHRGAARPGRSGGRSPGRCMASRRRSPTAASGHPQPLSWQELLTGDLGAKAGRYRFVLANVKLNFASFAPGGAATRAMRAAIARLPDVRDGSARVRITGGVALTDEEFGTVARGMAIGTVASLVLITLWLVLAVRSWRLIVPMLMTLWLGLGAHRRLRRRRGRHAQPDLGRLHHPVHRHRGGFRACSSPSATARPCANCRDPGAGAGAGRRRGRAVGDGGRRRHRLRLPGVRADQLRRRGGAGADRRRRA